MTVLLCFIIYFQKTVIVDVTLEAKDDGDIANESLKRALLSLLLLMLFLL
jgi:hypothetical protein